MSGVSNKYISGSSGIDWMFLTNNRRRLIKPGKASFLDWRRAVDVCIAFSHTCLHFLFAFYVTYKQVKHYGHEQQQASLVQPCSMTGEEKQEMYLRMEALEGTLNNLDALSVSEGRLVELESKIVHVQEETHRRIETLEGSLSGLGRSEERLAELESQVTHVQEDIHRRMEALEGTLNGLVTSEERLAKLESQVTQLQQAFQVDGQAKAMGGLPEQPKHALLTARNFAALHGVDWNQMQAWIDTQTLTPALSAEGLPDYLLTVDQQSTLIRYWRSRKVPYTSCEQCPHYILFGPQR